jgi:hypothetical protein
VYAADIRSSHAYTIKHNNNGSTPVITMPSMVASTVNTYYNIDGMQLTSSQKCRVVIVKKADGITVKVVR